MFSTEQIARVCHEANRAYCATLGDDSQVAWEDAPDWQRESALGGVEFHRANPDAGPDHSHNEWMRQKVTDGWVHGPVKDQDKKQHPDMVPYEQLSTETRAKDYLFRGIVHSFVGAEST